MEVGDPGDSSDGQEAVVQGVAGIPATATASVPGSSSLGSGTTDPAETAPVPGPASASCTAATPDAVPVPGPDTVSGTTVVRMGLWSWFRALLLGQLLGHRKLLFLPPPPSPPLPLPLPLPLFLTPAKSLTQFLSQFRPHHRVLTAPPKVVCAPARLVFCAKAARALTVVDPPPVPAPRTRSGGGAVEEMADLAASPELFSPLTGSEAAVPRGEAPSRSVEGEAMPTSVDLLTPMDWGDSIQPSSPVEKVGAEWARVAIRKRASSGEMDCPRVVKAAPIITVNRFEVLAVPTEGESASSDMDMEVGSRSNFLDSWDVEGLTEKQSGTEEEYEERFLEAPGPALGAEAAAEARFRAEACAHSATSPSDSGLSSHMGDVMSIDVSSATPSADADRLSPSSSAALPPATGKTARVREPLRPAPVQNQPPGLKRGLG
ncbi:hypothetical protein AAFF_G00373890 [Aldrovandia affinis]|uniref:Uncharacterized protein n=1 Tax=Aldrovandia affinis TaxID=143900 RepID=A0AAD7R4T4_9TELE|nr:hypothetical protein AAFF_G00373890 [Aldrovandia affinis]